MKMLFNYSGFLPYIVVVFLNAFVDLGHKIIIQNTIFKIYDGQEQIILTAIVNALILIPFVLLVSPVGFCSDKLPKNKVMLISAWAAIGITLCITLFYYLGWFWPAFVMTFVLALQSAFYSPAKYGYIKEMVGNNNLARANGLVQATTTVAILSSIFVFSIFFEVFLIGTKYNDTSSLLINIAPIGWSLVVLSIIELGLAYKLPQKYAVDAEMKFEVKNYISGQYLKSNMRAVLGHETIFLSIIGLAIFWAISQVILAIFPTYVKETLSITNTIIIQGILACSGMGIMLGSIIAGRLSKTRIETGLIPVGSIGITFCLLILPALSNVYLQAILFFGWGIFGGFILIPLNSLIQFHAEKNELGRILASSNLIQNTVMLIFLGLTMLFALYGINSLTLFHILSVVAILGTFYTVYKLPQSFAQFIANHVIVNVFRPKI